MSELNCLTNPSHIDYVGRSCQNKLDFSLSLKQELQLRGVPGEDQLESFREYLQNPLYNQDMYIKLVNAVNCY